jgi:CO/xanthine dehydrogenase FAD-binding subunit
MGLPPFDYYRPSSLDETLQLVKSMRGEASVLAGGTDLIPRLRHGTIHPRAVVDIGELDELRIIDLTEHEVQIGTLATHAELAASTLIQSDFSALAAACRAVAGPPVRNRGTIGGNLANASPAADTAPPLLALDARVHLVSHQGPREVPLTDFFVGPGETSMRQGELIASISAPLQPPRSAGVFLKYGRRSQMAIAVVSVAVHVTFADGPEEASQVRIALGSVAPVPMRAYEAEELLVGTPCTAVEVKKAARRAADATRPISDIRASADYRRLLTSVLVERAVLSAVDKARGEGGSPSTKCTSK